MWFGWHILALSLDKELVHVVLQTELDNRF